VVISLRIKKPAAKHPFKPLVLRLRLKYAGKPVAAKIKASTKKLFHSVKNLTRSLYQKKIRNASTVFSHAWTFSAAFCGAKTAAEIPLRSGSCYVK